MCEQNKPELRVKMNHAALLVMDIQNGIVSRFAENEDAMIPFQKAVEAARRSEIPVIFVREPQTKITNLSYYRMHVSTQIKRSIAF